MIIENNDLYACIVAEAVLRRLWEHDGIIHTIGSNKWSLNRTETPIPSYRYKLERDICAKTGSETVVVQMSLVGSICPMWKVFSGDVEISTNNESVETIIVRAQIQQNGTIETQITKSQEYKIEGWYALLNK